MSDRAVSRTAATTWAAASGSAVKCSPPRLKSGLDRFTSIAVTPGASESRWASVTYSSTLPPATDTTARAPRESSHGRSRCTNTSMPGPCKPTVLSTPLGVSAIRGAGQPARGSTVTDLVTTAPIRAMSKNRASSRPAPAHPAAVTTGLASSSSPA